eukprot:9297779-Pyramimonas_sp.AAC.2
MHSDFTFRHALTAMLVASVWSGVASATELRVNPEFSEALDSALALDDALALRIRSANSGHYGSSQPHNRRLLDALQRVKTLARKKRYTKSPVPVVNLLRSYKIPGAGGYVALSDITKASRGDPGSTSRTSSNGRYCPRYLLFPLIPDTWRGAHAVVVSGGISHHVCTGMRL